MDIIVHISSERDHGSPSAENQNDNLIVSADSSSISENQIDTSTGSTMTSPSLRLQGDMETRIGNSASALPDDFICIPIHNNSERHNGIPSLSADSYPTENQTHTYIEAPATRPDEMSLSSLPILWERKTSHKLCLDLYKAALEGDVVKGRRLIRKYAGSLSAAITDRHQTVLHIAAGAKQTCFVEEMINSNVRDNPINLRLQDRTYYTAFCFAAMAGSKEIAEIMLRRDSGLLKIRGGGGLKQMTPLYLAVLFGQREVASFLYDEMKREPEAKEELEKDKGAIFFASIETTLYDLALKLLKDDEENELTVHYYTYCNAKMTPLHRLAQTPLHLLNQSSKRDKTDLTAEALKLVEVLLEKILEKKGEEVMEYFEEDKDLLFDAARLGNFKFLAKLIELYPDLVHQRDDKGQSIFHIAIDHRHGSLFSLIYDIGFNKQLIAEYLDKDGNSILHLAAKYPNQLPNQITAPDAALEMQRELKTFKEVESLVKPSYKERKNSEGKTPREVFTRHHAALLKQGEERMRKKAESCMLVVTLITTVVFAAAFSLPGGNDQEKGIPIHLEKPVFGIFSILDSITLSSSTISILMFWSILISRFEENEFLIKLPRKLAVGLLTLFISISSMMVTFGSAYFLAYTDRIIPVPILIATILLVPFIVFILLEYGLLKELLYSSFRYRFSKKMKI